MDEKEVGTKVIPIVTLIAIFTVGLFTFVLANASEITPENIETAVNNERISHGLAPLRVSPELQNAAISKTTDMMIRNYFDHYAFGQTPWMFMLKSGYNYATAGENLAKGFSTSEGVVTAWMNSPTHRANILNPDYQDIGVGVVKGSFSENGQTKETILTTEMAAKPKSAILKIIERISTIFASIF